ncbi:MAG TPA: LruC domain-containing protein, partial [bacterium]|nr:LruC domain-containing protein [bacterium]
NNSDSSSVDILSKITSSFAEYNYIGDYNSNGRPDYLTDPDDISQNLLDFVENSLPEYNSVVENNPEYLADGSETNIVLQEDAEVWVTFIHEGAGYKNALGYYTYSTGSPPTTSGAINSLNIIYPNASLVGGGGEMQPGDKVYLGNFSAGTTIAWFLVADGWDGSDALVNDGRSIFYSDPDLNPDQSQQSVLLNYSEEGKILLGFEDILSGSGDEDYNDALFYNTVNPASAVETDNIYEPPPVTDSDNDGVNDPDDDYPQDPDKAFTSHFPGQEEYGTIAFEDQWPKKGDYDFNDLVMGYNFTHIIKNIKNGDNQVMQIDGQLVIRAIGAAFENGFGLEFENIAPNKITSVSGIQLTENYIQTEANGTEANQSNAVVLLFDSTYPFFNGYNQYINTYPNGTTVVPDTLNFTIELSGVSVNDFPLPPYDPFLIIDGDRSREIHLADHDPTDLAAQNLFGSEDDISDPQQDRYYIDINNMPWALHFTESFDYPIEKSRIKDAYLHFDDWAGSGGTVFSDWYSKNNPGFRKIEFIYTSP